MNKKGYQSSQKGEDGGISFKDNPPQVIHRLPVNYKFSYTSISESELIEILDQLPQRRLLAGRAQVRLSLAGAQNKVALFKEGKEFSLPLHESPSSHFLKPEWERFPKLSLNEAYCLNLARRAGLPTTEAEAITFGPHHCLVVERYDRIRDRTGQLQRLHQEGEKRGQSNVS